MEELKKAALDTIEENKELIASVADHGIGNIHQPKVFLDLTELLFVFQIDQAICRATDPEGGMQFHRFL